MKLTTGSTLFYAALLGMLSSKAVALVPPAPPPQVRFFTTFHSTRPWPELTGPQRSPDLDLDRRAPAVTPVPTPVPTGTDERAVYDGTTYLPDKVYSESTKSIASASGETALAEFTKVNQPAAASPTTDPVSLPFLSCYVGRGKADNSLACRVLQHLELQRFARHGRGRGRSRGEPEVNAEGKLR